MNEITVIGAGNMGTALSQVIAKNGFVVNLWNWEKEPEPLNQIKRIKENKKYLPGVKLSKRIKPVFNIEEAVKNVSIVFLVLPTFCVIENFTKLLPFLKKGVTVVNCSKGVWLKSLNFTHIDLQNMLGTRGSVVTMSGPAVAEQMVKDQPTFMNVASKDKKTVLNIKRILENNHLKLFFTNDMIGVEIGGLVKNVYAILLGICDGAGFSQNTKVIFIDLALQETKSFMSGFGCKKETVYNLACLGDIIATGFSKESRNRRFGELLGGGKDQKQAFKLIKQTVEGVNSTKALLKMAKKRKINMPLAELVHKCINTKGKDKQKKLLEGFLVKS